MTREEMLTNVDQAMRLLHEVQMSLSPGEYDSHEFMQFFSMAEHMWDTAVMKKLVEAETSALYAYYAMLSPDERKRLKWHPTMTTTK